MQIQPHNMTSQTQSGRRSEAPSTPHDTAIPSVAPPTADVIRREGVAALNSLLAGGAQVTKHREVRAFFMKADVPVTAEKFVRAVEDGSTSHHLTVGQRLPIALRGLDDLAAVAVIYGAGSPTLASHPGLAVALKTLSSQVTFKASDCNPAVKGRDSVMAGDVGPLGAWQALTGDAPFVNLELQPASGPTLRPSNPDEVVAYACFYAGGTPDALANKDLGVAITQLTRVGASLGDARDAFDAYVTLGEKAPDTRISLKSNDKPLLTVERRTLETDDDLPHRFIEATQQCTRLAAVDATRAAHATSVLQEGDAPLTGADGEQAMMTLLGLHDSFKTKEVATPWLAIREGVPVGGMQAAAEEMKMLVGHLSARQDSNRDLIEAWRGLRAVDSADPSHVASADKRATYLRLLAYTASGADARKAFEVIHEDGRSEDAPAREAVFRSLLQKFTRVEKDPTVGIFTLIGRNVPPEERTAALQRIDGLVQNLDGGLLRFLPDLVGFLGRDLPASVPPFMTYSECADRCARLFVEGRGSSDAVSQVWGVLAKATTPQEMADREAVLSSLMTTRPRRLYEVASDFVALDNATSLRADETQRYLPLLAATKSCAEATAAITILDRIALPTDVGARDAIFCAVADAARERNQVSGRGYKLNEALDAYMDDYWYVVRSCDLGGSEPQAVARAYASYLKATHGNSAEARQAYATTRLQLQEAGPVGLGAEKREALLRHALSATGSTEQAMKVLHMAEAASTPEQAQARVAAFEGVLSLASGMGSKTPLESSLRFVEALSSLAPGAQQQTLEAAVESLTAACGALSTRNQSLYTDISGKFRWNGADPVDLLQTALLTSTSDLTTLVAELGVFGSYVRQLREGWPAVTLWPLLREGTEPVPLPERAAALAQMLSSHSPPDVATCLYSSALRGSDDAETFASNLADVRTLAARSPKDAIASFEAVREFVASTAVNATPKELAARRNCYVQLLASFPLKRDAAPAVSQLAPLWKQVRTPLGREDISEREASFFDLLAFETRRGAENPLQTSFQDYAAIARGLYPGDALRDSVTTFTQLADVLHDSSEAATIVSRLQKERLTGLYGSHTLPELLASYGQAVLLGNPAERALEAMRKSNATAPIEATASEVVVGGVRIPRREP